MRPLCMAFVTSASHAKSRGSARPWRSRWARSRRGERLAGAGGNPVALYLEKLEDGECRITARLSEWRHVVGVGATVNKAAGNYELSLKAAVPADGAYEGPYWNSGIKAEKPAPPKPAPAPAAPASS